MNVAVKSDGRINVGMGRASLMLGAGTFTGLNAADRQALADWLDQAGGIDSVMDLAFRPWNISSGNILAGDIAAATSIFGIFETGRDQATWLIVRYGSGWTLARCEDGFVSHVMDSMTEALRLIDELRR